VRKILPGVLLLLACRLAPADSDVAGSQDFAGFPRYPGFVITDYDEDNPASVDLPAARPLPIDAAHVETIHLTGHRYVIRYELDSDVNTPSIWQVQEYYDQRAADGGYQVEKSGAVGDVSETFAREQDGRQTWVCVEPGASAISLIAIESSGPSVPLGHAPSASVAPSSVAAAPAKSAPRAAAATSGTDTSADAGEDPLYVALVRDGRVLLPLTFLPGKPDVAADAQPYIDRVVRMLQKHPQARLVIQGHTDNTGDPDYNRTLSDERARAIRALIASGGISRRRLSAIGLGGENPVAPNNTAEGRAQNRRIELVLLR
jgi:outer membrane protein OmpA-like peptidoglycan-associated protein